MGAVLGEINCDFNVYLPSQWESARKERICSSWSELFPVRVYLTFGKAVLSRAQLFKASLA